MRFAPPGIGAVYFRKTSPPQDDWERDHLRAAADGHRIFRHWVPWHVVEVSPGRYQWSDYDRLLELAQQNGIRVVLAELVTDVPEWLVTALPNARIEGRLGAKRFSEMHVSCATGGHHVLCLDHPDVREQAAKFLETMARRYRGHPALVAYDVWNECTYYTPERFCFCRHTEAAFRAWLRAEFGEDVQRIAQRWKRPSITQWDDVRLSRAHSAFADSLDTLRFFTARGLQNLRWRIHALRQGDESAVISAHGYCRSFADLAAAGNDDHRAAAEVDIWGYTYWHGTGCPPLMAADLARSAARGKEFWRAEAAGNHDWFHRGAIGKPNPTHDRMNDPGEIRLDAMISLASGASAYLNPRWRPLLDGPLFDAFGWYELDGSPSERSEEVRRIATRLAHPDLKAVWRARPVRGELGLLLLEDAQADDYVRNGAPKYYGAAFRGAWSAWRQVGVCTDIVRMEDIGEYSFLYAPLATAVRSDHLATLADWVNQGGTLMVEGPFAFFDEIAHAYPEQPNRGWRQLIGARTINWAFAPDRLARVPMSTPCGEVTSSVYRNSFALETAEVVARFSDGSPAAIRNLAGKGAVITVSGSIGWSFDHEHNPATVDWLRSLLPTTPRAVASVRSATKNVAARLWADDDGNHFLWLVNEDPSEVTAEVSFPRPLAKAATVCAPADPHSASLSLQFDDDQAHLQARISARDCTILRLV
jgi:beta-galactosidase